MISEKDIEAWREDEKQTEHLSTRRKADNHVGWGVERLTSCGWTWPVDCFRDGITYSYKEYAEALQACKACAMLYPTFEFRVYEIIKEK